MSKDKIYFFRWTERDKTVQSLLMTKEMFDLYATKYKLSFATHKLRCYKMHNGDVMEITNTIKKEILT